MPEVRQDPTTGAWCVLSGDRGHRPVRLVTPVLEEPAQCPFCPGNEGVTLPTLASVEGPDGWLVRAFPNRYPALRVEETGAALGAPPLVGATGLGLLRTESPSMTARSSMRLLVVSCSAPLATRSLPLAPCLRT